MGQAPPPSGCPHILTHLSLMKPALGLGRGDLLVPVISITTADLESEAERPRLESPPQSPLRDSHVVQEALHSCLPLCR